MRFCLKCNWLAENLVEDIEAPVGSSSAADRLPFPDEELEKMYRACESLGEIHWKNNFGEDTWWGEDAKDFIVVLLYTGRCISDVAPLFTWIPDWLMERLQGRRQKTGAGF